MQNSGDCLKKPGNWNADDADFTADKRGMMSAFIRVVSASSACHFYVVPKSVFSSISGNKINASLLFSC